MAAQSSTEMLCRLQYRDGAWTLHHDKSWIRLRDVQSQRWRRTVHGLALTVTSSDFYAADESACRIVIERHDDDDGTTLTFYVASVGKALAWILQPGAYLAENAPICAGVLYRYDDTLRLVTYESGHGAIPTTGQPAPPANEFCITGQRYLKEVCTVAAM